MKYKASKIEAALSQKGFESKETHHRTWTLMINGKRSHIHTYISRGNPEYAGTLLSKLRKQLGGLDHQQIDRFIKCPMKGAEYLKILAEKHVIDARDAPTGLDFGEKRG